MANITFIVEVADMDEAAGLFGDIGQSVRNNILAALERSDATWDDLDGELQCFYALAPETTG